jgi:hypothetical protein
MRENAVNMVKRWVHLEEPYSRSKNVDSVRSMNSYRVVYCFCELEHIQERGLSLALKVQVVMMLDVE